MQASAERQFEAGHPTSAGHFPGNSIIPGAVLLDEVARAIGTGSTPTMLDEILTAKFLHPVRPGDRIIIRWETTPSGTTRFECRLAEPDTLVLSGTLRMRCPSR
jgi:3-hydroxyacyl-[acyl-carrier-protein] dehydratase